MTWQPELDELRAREAEARKLGGADKIARQHAGGRLTVRERIEGVIDPGSFREIGAIAGVEARMGDRLDLYMHVPLTVVVGGDAVTREQTGAGVLTAEMVDEPPALGGFGAGALFGVQVRLFKPRQPETKAADEDPDF